MYYLEKDPGIAAMSDAAEGGGSLAWRLLATLEGGSLVLAASALLAYSARGKARARWTAPSCARVALTNTTSELGRALKRRLEAQGCVVSEVTSGATSGAVSGAENEYDVLVVVGSQLKADGLDGISSLVSDDVYNNIKLLETLSPRIKRGGCIAWACAGADRELGAFGNTATAFDAVLQASLEHVAQVIQCVPLWAGRGEDAESTATQLVAALFTRDTPQHDHRFSIRNVAHTVGEYLYRWLKLIT